MKSPDNASASTAGPDPVMRLARSFMESRVLLTAAELDLFTLLARQPATAEDLATAHHWRLRPLTVVLDALAGMGLLEKSYDVYHCPEEVESRLSADSIDSLIASVLHVADLWEAWSGLTVQVAGGKPGAPARPDTLQAFIDSMHAIARPLAARLVAAVKPAGAKRLLDVGGASGTYTMAFLAVEPNLRVTLFDLPEVIPLSRGRLEAAGVLGRVSLVPGNYLNDPLPGGHDLAWLSAVIHSNGPEENLALYRKVADALVPGGRIVIRDHVMSEDHTAPRAGALFAVNMLVATRSGRTYAFHEISGALTEAGFRDVRLIQTGEAMDGLVEARKPA